MFWDSNLAIHITNNNEAANATYCNPASPFLGIYLTEIKDLCTMIFTVKLLRWLKFGNYLNIQIDKYQFGNNCFIVHSYHELSVLQFSQVCDSCTEGMTMRKVTDGYGIISFL